MTTSYFFIPGCDICMGTVLFQVSDYNRQQNDILCRILYFEPSLEFMYLNTHCWE